MVNQAVRSLANPRRCQQRLGFLKPLLAKCAQTSTSSLQTLGLALVDAVTRKVTAPVTPEAYEYVKERLTDRAYREVKASLAALPEGEREQHPLKLEIQDWYLSDSALTSRTGKLVAEDWRRFPLWATALGLVRPGSYSPLVRGVALLQLTPGAEQAAWQTYAPESNPLRLSLPQRLFLLFTVLEADGDALRGLYAGLTADAPFSDRDAGDLLPDVYRTLAKQLQLRIRSGDDLKRVQQFQDAANNIAAWKGKSYSGGGANIEHVTPRLEPFADLGLLDKPDPYRYEYAIADAGQLVFGALKAAEGVAEFLDHAFFTTAAQAYGRPARPADEATTLSGLYRACADLKSPLGYAPIRDALLLSGVRALTGDGLIIEPAAGLDVLKAYQREYPLAVRFNVDRMGALAYVKFEEPPSLPEPDADLGGLFAAAEGATRRA